MSQFIEKYKDAWTSIEDDFNIYYLGTNSDILFETSFKVKEHLWNKNRPIDDNKVSEIVSTIETAMEKGLSTPNKEITIGTVLQQDPVIMDGQHRCHAFRQLTGVKFKIQLINYQTEEERFEGFKEINSNTALPDYYKDQDSRYKDMAKRIAKYQERDEAEKMELLQKLPEEDREEFGDLSLSKIKKLVARLTQTKPDTLKEIHGAVKPVKMDKNYSAMNEEERRAYYTQLANDRLNN